MKKERNIFGFGGSFVGICDKAFDVLALGFLWIVCSLPIITIGASSTALYYAMVKCVKNNDGYASKEFFHSFKTNLVQSTVIWVILVGATLAMHLNIGILMKETSGYLGLFFICVYVAVSIYLLVMACYAFPALSRYDMSVGWIMKISMYMGVRYLLTSLALLMILVCFGIFIWKIPMLMFLAPGPAVFLMSEFLERVLQKHEPRKEGGLTE